ncbi:MAG TPA: fibronectin type III domain-containing protein, partial [Tepidisphaeraceae bacterium]
MIAPRRRSSDFFHGLESRTLFSNFAPVIVPTNLTATPLSSSEIRLTWTDTAVNELTYVIYRSTSVVPSTFQPVIMTTPGAEAWVDKTAVPGTQYFYKLRGVAHTATSAFSNLTNATSLTLAEDVFAKLDANT